MGFTALACAPEESTSPDTSATSYGTATPAAEHSTTTASIIAVVKLSSGLVVVITDTDIFAHTSVKHTPVFEMEGRKEMFYLTTHSKHCIYGYMASDIWLRTILIVRKETRCRHIGYSLRITARVLLYAPSHRQDSTYHGLCYTSRGALAGTRNSSMGPPHEGSIRRPIAP